ncbi:MAG: hypothetical protein GY835_27525, partial [bacterium]|nr:hypothetical protein [bacterium]
TGADQAHIEAALADYQTRLQTYLDGMDPDTALSDARTVIPSARRTLAGSHPYHLVAKAGDFARMPAYFRHSITIKIYHSLSARHLDSPALTHTLGLPELNSRRLGLSYEPESEADAAALEKFRVAGATSIPLYLIRVKPVLKLDGAVLTEGSGIGMGQPQYYTLKLKDPRNIYAVKGIVTAGDEAVFGINGNGIAPEVIQKRLDVTDSNTAEENLHQTALHFWMEHDALDAIAARAYGVYKQRMPSAGVFSAQVTAHYFMGIARSGYYRNRVLDVKHNVQVVRAPDERTRFDFMSHIGMQGSYLEGSVLDRLFRRAMHPAISTAQVLMEANARGIPIYTVTQANISSVLPQLSVSAEVKADIAHAVHSGKLAVTPGRELTLGNWTGTGYILQDAVTGAGAYLIDGGFNGGSWEGCMIEVKPQVQFRLSWFRNGVLLLAHTAFEEAQEALAKLPPGPETDAAWDLAVKIYISTLNMFELEPS